MPMKKILPKNKNVRAAILFAAFMFTQFVILRMGNQAGRGYLSDEKQEFVYLFIQIAVIVGYICHALAFSSCVRLRIYRPICAAALALCTAGGTVMLFCGSASPFCLSITGITVFVLGYVGGAVYCRIAALLRNGKRVGLCVGIGYAAAVLLQFLLQLNWMFAPFLVVLLLISFVVMFAFLADDGDGETPTADSVENDNYPRRKLILFAVITFALLIFTSYYNSYIHHLQVAFGYTAYNVYSWPRLLMIPCVILFGIIGDIKNGKLLPICTLCVAAVALLNAALSGRDAYLPNMCLYYVAITAAISYYHQTFLRAAPYTKRPSLWACMGRIIDSAVVIVSFGLRMAARSQVAVLIIDIAALAVIIVAMATNGDFDLSSHIAADAPDAVENADDSVDRFSAIREKYHITPSEMNVLRELVLTDDKQDAIAARLDISVSTLRHHVTSIYRKTGVQTRSALCKLK